MKLEHCLRSILLRTMREVWREEKNLGKVRRMKTPQKQARLAVSSYEAALPRLRRGGASSPQAGQTRGIRLAAGVISQRQSWQQEQDRTEQDWVAKHIFQKPQREKSKVYLAPYEDGNKIKCDIEIHEVINPQGDLGLILSLTGIDLLQAPFVSGRGDYGPNSAVVYSSIRYEGKEAFLVLSTTRISSNSKLYRIRKILNLFSMKNISFPNYSLLMIPGVWPSPKIII